MMPIERTLADGRTPPRQKEISLGEVQNSRGFVGGGQPRVLEAYVLGLRDAIKITALPLM